MRRACTEEVIDLAGPFQPGSIHEVQGPVAQ